MLLLTFFIFLLKISVLLMCRLTIMNILVHLILINNLSETPDACGLLIIKMPFMFTNSLLISDNELLWNSAKSSKRSSHGPICLICKVCQPCLFCLICYFHILICNTQFWMFCSPPRVEQPALISFSARILIVLAASTHSAKILHCKMV